MIYYQLKNIRTNEILEDWSGKARTFTDYNEACDAIRKLNDSGDYEIVKFEAPATSPSVELRSKVNYYCVLLEKEFEKKYPDCEFCHHKFKFSVGKKFIKVIECDYRGGEQAVWCFVDFDGNLYKAASWSAPASGIRGHVDKPIMNLAGFYR